MPIKSNGQKSSVPKVASGVVLALVASSLLAQENLPTPLGAIGGRPAVSDPLFGLRNQAYVIGALGLQGERFNAATAPRTANVEETLLETYVTTLGPEDYFNSSGVRLKTLAGIVAQDRANFYRFGIRHRSDSPDEIFVDRNARSLIGSTPVTICCSLEPYILDAYDRGYAPVVSVSVFGNGEQINRLFLEVTGLPDIISD